MAEKKVEVKIVGRDTLSPTLKKTSDNVKKSTGQMKNSVNGLSKAFKGLAAGAGAALVMREVVKLAGEASALFQKQERAEAKLNAVLKATGGAAGLTSKQLKNMATELQRVTTFGDEATIEAQALMLTFRQIGGEVFPRAIKAAQDMSTLFGGLDSASIQLGKALNDPKTGISALARVGITFSDVQKEQIKRFQDTNQIAKAQGVILKELEMQFGGVAEAMAQTNSGQLEQAKNTLGDMKETLGKDIIPLQTEWVKTQMQVVGLINETIVGWNKLLGLKNESIDVDDELRRSLVKRKDELQRVISMAEYLKSIDDPRFDPEVLNAAEKAYDGILKKLADISKTQREARESSASTPGATTTPTAPGGGSVDDSEKFPAGFITLGDLQAEEEAKAEKLLAIQAETNAMWIAEKKRVAEEAKAMDERDAANFERIQLAKIHSVQMFVGGFADLLAVAGKENEKAARAAKAVATAEAIVNTALAATQAYKVGMSAGYPVGLVLGPLAAAGALAAGVAQIATINSAKFADGGIVGGQSFGGDNVNVRANSGELILNNRQQQNLFSAINNGNFGGASINVSDTIVINGNADESTIDAIVQTREDQLYELKQMMSELQLAGQLN